MNMAAQPYGARAAQPMQHSGPSPTFATQVLSPAEAHAQAMPHVVRPGETPSPGGNVQWMVPVRSHNYEEPGARQDPPPPPPLPPRHSPYAPLSSATAPAHHMSGAPQMLMPSQAVPHMGMDMPSRP